MKHKPKTTTASSDHKVFDVRRPGKVSVSATSRPVIVGHKPQVQDPMVSQSRDDHPLMDGTKHVTITPMTASAKPEAEPAPLVSSEQYAPPATDARPIAPASAPAVEPEPETAADLASVAMQQSTVIDEPPLPTPAAEPAPATPATPTPPPQSASEQPLDQDDYLSVLAQDTPTAPPPKEHAEPLPVLPPEAPAQPQIYVSHHKQRKPAAVLGTLLLLLILAAVVVDVLLDAGFIVIDGIPHTTFF